MFNSTGEPCNPAKALECKLVSDITGAEVAGSFKKLVRQNRYEISYLPAIKGWHQLHITVDGQHFRGSPYSVAVTSSSFGELIHTIVGVEGPYGIAINNNGEIVVSETGGRDRISVYSPSGRKIRTIRVSLGLFGDSSGNLRGLTCDGDGNIIVCEHRWHSIRKYSPEGKLLLSMGTAHTFSKVWFERPFDLAFNTANNRLYVADTDHHKVKVLNSDFTLHAAFREGGQDKGEFLFMRGITCDNAGNVYVADWLNHCIHVFTAEGEFLRSFGRSGTDRVWPVGIALDPSNNLVLISDNNCITVFTVEGQFVTSFDCGFKPNGLAVDNCGVVYVCNCEGNCVQVF